MKPLGVKNYGSIPHLFGSKLGKTDKYIHEGQHRILTEKTRDRYDLVIVTEKYDGSNVGVTRKNGNILALTRSGYLANTSPYKQHHVFSNWVETNKKRFSHLKEGERIVGEWLYQVHSIEYKIMCEPFVIFDSFNSSNERNLFSLTVHKASLMELETVRIIGIGNCAFDIQKCLRILNKRNSVIQSIEKPEGLVYRVERKDKFDFMAKYVRPDYESGKHINVDEKDFKFNCVL